MARALVKTHIRGFDDDVLRGGIPQGHVILIRGASGTMKSSLAYYVLYHNALAGVPGLYVTLEQSAGSRLEHVTDVAYQRRVQCVRMRSVNQDSDDRTLLFENGRFEVARAIG